MSTATTDQTGAALDGASAARPGARWPAVLDQWRTAQQDAGVSRTVVAQRFGHLRHFAEHPVSAGLDPATVTAEDVARYLVARRWSATTQRNNVKSLRAFYRWAHHAGLCTADPTETVAVNLTPAEAATINRRRRVNPEHVRPGPAPRSVPASWSDLIEGWITHARAAGLTVPTVRLRSDHMRRLARDLSPLHPAEVTTTDLEEWIGSGAQRSNETRRSCRSSVRALFSWAHQCGHMPSDPAATLRVVKATVPVARPAAEQHYHDALSRADDRQTVILLLAAELGLRRAEVARVHAADVIDTTEGAALLVHGKGGKRRVLPLPPHIERAIRDRLAAIGPHGYLLPGVDTGTHLTPAYVAKLLRAVLPDGVTMHQLRHRFATVAYRHTHDVLGLQQLLGHSSPATTQRYVAVDQATLRGIVSTARPRFGAIA